MDTPLRIPVEFDEASLPLPVFLPKDTIAYLAEQIAVAASDLRDPNGLKIWTRGNLKELEYLALKVVGEWVKAPVRQLGTL